MAADVTKVKVGVCTVTFNGVDLGHTIDGVVINYEPDYHDVMVDKYGSTVVEKVLKGEKFSVTVKLAEFSIANLKVAVPKYGSASSSTKMQVGSNAGGLLTSSAATLVLHPIANSAGDRTEDVVIYKAVSSEPIELPYKNDEERAYEVTFTALLDETKSSGNYLGLIGDSAA